MLLFPDGPSFASEVEGATRADVLVVHLPSPGSKEQKAAALYLRPGWVCTYVDSSG